MNKFIASLLLLITVSVLAQSNPFYVSFSDKQETEHWIFDRFDTTLTVTGSWSLQQPYPQALFGVNSYYYSLTNKVFICGGATQSVVPQSRCRWYNVSTNTYEDAAPLPEGRWSGKLVRVRDSLYLIGSVDSTFSSADGLIFKYSINQNTWVLKDTMPVPFVHECAVAVINDSLIVTIGGSTNAFLNPVNITRIYDPRRDTWRVTTPYPVNVTTAHADYQRADSSSNIIVLGGFGAGYLDLIYKGVVNYNPNDTITITWSLFGDLGLTKFGRGVYRVAGARWNDYLLFGPAMNNGSVVNQVWGLLVSDTSIWIQFTPSTSDTAGNFSSYGVKSGSDSSYFYFFGGYKNLNVLDVSKRYAFTAPVPIGIVNISNNAPGKYKLYQNYPNPFNPSTKIKFSIPESGHVILKVFDVTGRLVEVLADTELSSGTYETEFSGRSGIGGRYLASGIYFYTLNAGNNYFSMKMILIK